MKHDAYGPGIHSDATGRPFKFKTFDGQDVGIFDVKPNPDKPEPKKVFKNHIVSYNPTPKEIT
jgi:hypothetical protein